LIAVDEAAYVALTRILKTSRFGPASTHGYDRSRRRTVAGEIRALWAKTRGGSAADRWYATLADDHGTPEQWVEAAGRIVQPVDVEVRGGWVNEPQRKPGEVPAMKGESLRTKRDPTVSELMKRRVDQLSAMGSAGSERTFNLHKACDVALCLGAWDRAAAGPVLLKQIARCRDYPRDNAWDRGSWTLQILGRYIARMTISAARGGSAEALAAYADWVRTITPESVSDYGGDVLEPLWRFHDDPKVAAAAEWLFNDRDSPWRSLIAADAKLRHGLPLEMVRSPLVGLPAFRTALLRGLKDTAKVGTVTPDGNGRLQIEFDGAGTTGTMMRYADDPLAPKRGTAVPFRACDLYAWRLSELEGTPLCELYWPQEKRDAAVAAAAEFLERWGDRFAFKDQPGVLSELRDAPPARMTFPRLDRPATEADVKAGRAIFSLGGASDRVRVWPMPHVPMKGKWTTLKEFPRQRQTYEPKTGKSGLQLDYEQVGRIWQAEEVREGDHWRRYYGWVGRYRIAKVPADEIEIVPDDYRE
jgi:hypothetical protein